MAAKTGDGPEPPDRLPTRDSICVSLPAPNSVIHNGDHGFQEELGRHYRDAESIALERMFKLKAALKATRTEEEFWPMAAEGLAAITGSQYAFINKRVVPEDEDANVEMPPYGTPGSCIMSQAMYFDDGHGHSGGGTNLKYSVYGAPCGYMKHDKVFLLPERLNEAITGNPNAAAFVVPAEAYLAVPLFDNDGKCFGHFGGMWSLEGLQKRQLSWAFTELLYHSIEDVLWAGFKDRGRFASALKAIANPNAIIPHEVIAATQSLKPYARNLSHELRTPMQGVVGMLDVMYATVQEATEGVQDEAMRSVLDGLKENIEVVQDSSRRAVEAADNVVHAYDMNMGVPDTPMSPPDENSMETSHRRRGTRKEKRPDIVVTGENVPINFKGNKRRRGSDSAVHGKVHKMQKLQQASTWPDHPVAATPEHEPTEYLRLQESVNLALMSPTTAHLENCQQTSVPPGLRHTNLRDVLQFLVNDLLKVGGRPESAIAHETDGGEIIEVHSRSPNGETRVKTIKWDVHSAVPATILIEEQSLVKVISSVYSNAVKFTDEGEVIVEARLSPRSQYVVIGVSDTGSGIHEEFVPKLFQPFSKEDDSLTRQSEGLGLGLMVAKGLARKLGGDLNLKRTRTAGEKRGSEFEIQVPITPSDSISRPLTPSSSPGPTPGSKHSVLDGLEQLDESLRLRADGLKSSAASMQLNRQLDQLRDSSSPLTPASKAVKDLSVPTPRRSSPAKRTFAFDRDLSTKFPLTFLVVEDNKINRTLLVSMLRKLGYKHIYEAYDGAHAVRQMETLGAEVDVVLMDLWMPFMDGYEASERILAMDCDSSDEEDEPTMRNQVRCSRRGKRPAIMAVTADVTEGALERADKAGMKGFLTKPFKVMDLERLIVEHCSITRGLVKMSP
ncbi:sensor histidine kinase-like protein/response regulator [Venturia nashicola]|uniref:histidine kinase n=1 Tax=Venturia nashicola TaxID=86259 RepID=A0A4Z1PWQ8_9PEZI|nr:sensor histidine kinase-like protein/response regulator [Venturia nashicola]TLD39392.1 sensor histidine kinase-like protein/response regulator [Venturia nashicola]